MLMLPNDPASFAPHVVASLHGIWQVAGERAELNNFRPKAIVQMVLRVLLRVPRVLPHHSDLVSLLYIF